MSIAYDRVSEDKIGYKKSKVQPAFKEGRKIKIVFDDEVDIEIEMPQTVFE
jgi:hypothetical protein